MKLFYRMASSPSLLLLAMIAISAFARSAQGEGNVSAIKTGNVLMIVGDSASNELRIVQVGNRSFTVGSTGLFQSSNTNINGSLSSKLFEGVDHLLVQMGDGHDALQIFGSNNATHAQIASIDIGTGKNDDYVQIFQVSANEILVKGFADTDSVQIEDSDATYLQVDLGEATSNTFTQTASIYGSFKTVEIFGGSKKDLVTTSNVYSDRFYVELGAGNDFASLSGLNGGYSKSSIDVATVKLGDGDDTLYYGFKANSRIDKVFFRCGSGYDWIRRTTPYGPILIFDVLGFERSTN